MFDYEKKPSLIAKALTICAIGMGVGFGTCGLAVFTGRAERGIGLAISVAGAVIFFVSLAGLVVTVVIFLVKMIVEPFQK